LDKAFRIFDIQRLFLLAETPVSRQPLK
jgi:hypothetical protein